jgi:hypothetical protein
MNVDENRQRPTVAHAVRGGYERVAGGNDLIAWSNPHGQQCQMKCGGATRDCAGMAGTDGRGELGLEGRHLRALRHPPGQDGPPGGVGLSFVHPGFGDWNKLFFSRQDVINSFENSNDVSPLIAKVVPTDARALAFWPGLQTPLVLLEPN